MASTPSDPTLDCPHCSGPDVVFLAFMRRYHADDWYRCDTCGHLFCVPKQHAWRSVQQAAYGRGTRVGREVA